MDLIAKAIEVATIAHKDQRRKYTNEPYIVHPQNVAAIVNTVTKDQRIIATAWLHDVVEDHPELYSLLSIEKIFGVEVSSLVEMVTDVSKPSDGNRKARKQIDLKHTAMASPDGQTVKLADLIDNAHSIVTCDPDFAKVYLKEKELLLKVLTKGSKLLQEIAYETLAWGQNELLQNKLGELNVHKKFNKNIR